MVAIIEGGGKMTGGTPRSLTPASQSASTASAERERRQEVAEALERHGVNAIRRSAIRPATPIAPTSPAESAAAANSAARSAPSGHNTNPRAAARPGPVLALGHFSDDRPDERRRRAIFMLAKKNGVEAGARSLRNVCALVADRCA